MDVTRYLASQRASQSINPQRTVLLLEPGDDGPVLPASFGREESEADKTAVIEQHARPAKESSTASTIGTRERFKLRKVVGRGGFGEVWSATQTALSRTVAVKVLNQRTIGDGESSVSAVGLFRAEALIAARLDHPNVVPVYDYQVNERGQPMLAMKFVHGEQWDLAIERDRSRPQGEFLARHLNFLIQVGNAVAFAHSRGIIHRDLKPSQVMLGKFGECLLMDWGLAIVLDTIDDDANPHHREALAEVPSLATATNPAGTPAYLAPEQTKASARDLVT